MVASCAAHPVASKLQAEGDEEPDLRACRAAVRRLHAQSSPNGPKYETPGARWGWLDRELSSNLAGETGAVMIYRGARCALELRGDSSGAWDFAADHEAAERRHQSYFRELLQHHHMHTALLPVWEASGFALGFVPTLFAGPAALFATVEAVESFVEEHYNAQIARLVDTEDNAAEDVAAVLHLLRLCCADEVHHKEDARSRLLGSPRGLVFDVWASTVRTGSALAAETARRV